MLEDRGAQEETDRGDLFVRLNLVGESPAFRRATTLISRVARCDATVLIQGETGTGKEVAARAIHYLGARREHAFVPINCAGLPDSLLESELFGHERGAFTDARERRHGLLAEARGGTLFLDEVEAMSARTQAVLLRFLQDRCFRPLGSNTLIDSDVRLVAASNADLGVLSQQGLFRRDLLFRLSVLVVPLPPLRERKGDAEILAESFLNRFSKTYEFPRRTLSSASRQWLASYGWPGNVRELESLVLRELLLGDGAGDEIDLTRSHVASGEESLSELEEPGAEMSGLLSFREAKAEAVARFERSYLRGLLEAANGNFSLAARRAGKDRTTLKRLLRRHGLDPSTFRRPGVSGSANAPEA